MATSPACTWTRCTRPSTSWSRRDPEMFDRERVVGHDGYKVVADDAFYLGVAGNLQAQGLCAVWDYGSCRSRRARR